GGETTGSAGAGGGGAGGGAGSGEVGGGMGVPSVPPPHPARRPGSRERATIRILFGKAQRAVRPCCRQAVWQRNERAGNRRLTPCRRW
ncbi:MAG: hypothetical protein F4023_13255, partial [Acidobacteria bacterium]|nr:hypothetical protein [Acidobacteriota bacterium]